MMSNDSAHKRDRRVFGHIVLALVAEGEQPPSETPSETDISALRTRAIHHRLGKTSKLGWNLKTSNGHTSRSPTEEIVAM